MLQALHKPWPDSRAERLLGAASLLVAACVLAMIAFVAVRAWPMLSHEGLSWLGSGGNVDRQLGAMVNTGPNPPASAFHLRAWPLLYGTLLTSGLAVLIALPLALLSSIFIVEFAPAAVRRVTIPTIRLLASVPSVIYGLIGVLVLVPFVGNQLVTPSEKVSMQDVVQLTGAGLGVAAVVLAVMVTPIMVALITDALGAVPKSWREGAIALGLHPLRATLAVGVRSIRPAIVAAAVLATARAIGEAVMLYMVSGSVGFAPRPSDGLLFFLEPLKTLAASIVENAEGIGAPALRSAVYSFALLLLFSAFALSLAGYLIKLPLRRHQVRG